MKEDARCCSCVYTGDRHTTTVPTAPRGREPSCLRTAGLGVGHFTLSLQRHFLLSWKSLFWQILNTEGKPGEAQAGDLVPTAGPNLGSGSSQSLPRRAASPSVASSMGSAPPCSHGPRHTGLPGQRKTKGRVSNMHFSLRFDV